MTLAGFAAQAGSFFLVSFSVFLGMAGLAFVILLYCVFRSVLGLAPGVLHFALCLFHSALDLSLGIASPLASLTLNAASYILNLAFGSIFIHESSSYVSHLNGAPRVS